MVWSSEGRRENLKLGGELVVLLEKEMVLEVSFVGLDDCFAFAY